VSATIASLTALLKNLSTNLVMNIDHGANVIVAGANIAEVLKFVSTGGPGNAYSNIFIDIKQSGTITLDLTDDLPNGITISDNAGNFTLPNGAPTLVVNQLIKIKGTLTGDGTITGYTDGKIYKVSAVVGTSFTLVNTDNSAIVTTTGTTAGLTFERAYTKPSTQGGVYEVIDPNLFTQINDNGRYTGLSPATEFTLKSDNAPSEQVG
jgi:hypothetical protein